MTLVKFLLVSVAAVGFLKYLEVEEVAGCGSVCLSSQHLGDGNRRINSRSSLAIEQV